MSITIQTSANASTVKDEAVRKLVAYGYIQPGDHKLLYPVSLEEICNIPGSDVPFTVERYKKDLGITQYGRMTVVVSSSEDYMKRCRGATGK